MTITALSASGTPTVNYNGLLARNVTLEAWSAPGMLVIENQNPLTMIPISVVAGHGALSAVAAGTFALGVADALPADPFPARYPVIAPATLASPTAIYLRARENTDIAADDATSARIVAAESIEAGVTVISGRFKVDNNYGSELLAVPVMTRTQYWNGTRFVDSTTDGQTSISAPDVARSNCKKNLRAGNDCVALILNTPASPTMVKGALRRTLSAPDTGNAGNTGSVDVNINSSTSPWLPSTKARIGMGIYKAGPIIYLREMY